MPTNYNTLASDWHASCVGSIAAFGGAGSGFWGFQLMSKTVCTAPVVFLYSGVGAGFGVGVSVPESAIATNSEPTRKLPKKLRSKSTTIVSQKSGFSKIKCDRPFSLKQLDGAAGRLSVGEAYFWGIGGGVVIISAFDGNGSFFNSQNLWGTGLSPTKKGGTLATTGGAWKGMYRNVIPRAKKSVRPDQDICAINQFPDISSDLSIKNFRKPEYIDQPTIRQR